MISAKLVPLKYYTRTLIATTMFNCLVFGSANSVTRPDRDNQYNMRIVYRYHDKQFSLFPRHVK